MSHADVNTNSYNVPSALKSVQKVLKLKVSNGSNQDETIFYFDDNASDNYDDYDTQKMSNVDIKIPELFTIADGKGLAINGFNAYSSATEIPLGFRTGENKSFNIIAVQMSNFDQNSKVKLRDNLLNIETELSEGTNYTFSSDVTDNSTRFSLLFRVTGTVNKLNEANITTNAFVYVNKNKQIEIYNASGAELFLYNSSGLLMETLSVKSNTVKFNQVLNPGIYLVNIKTGNKNSKYKILIK